MAGQVKREEYVLPKGWKCPKCKGFNFFSLWVYAHFSEPITWTCEKCGHQQAIQNGRIVRGN